MTMAGSAWVDILPNLEHFGGELDGAASMIVSKLDGIGKLGGAAFAGALGVAIGGVGALEAIGSKFDSAYDKIRVGTGATGAALDTLKDNFRTVAYNVPASFDTVASTVTKLSQVMHASGDDLNTLGVNFIDLARVTKTDVNPLMDTTTRLFENFGVSVADAPDKLNELFRVTQQTGTPITDLAASMSSLGPLTRQAGLSFEQTAALVGTLNRAGLDSGVVMPALSRVIKDAAKDGHSAAEEFQGFFDRIKNAPNDTAAAGVAIEAFGARAGPRLSGLIREGKLSFDDLAKSIAGGGDTIESAADDTMHLSERFDLLKNRVLIGLEPLAMGVFDAFDRFGNYIAPKIEVAATYVTEFADAFSNAGTVVTPNMTTIQVLAVEVHQALNDLWDFAVNTLWPQMQTAFQVGGQVIQDVFAGGKRVIDDLASSFGTNESTILEVLAGITAGLIGLAIAWNAGPGIIITGVVALVAGFLYAYENFSTFRVIIQDTLTGIGTAFTTVRDTAQAVWPTIQQIISTVVLIVQAIWDNFGAEIKSVALGAWTFVHDYIEAELNIIRGVIQFVTALIHGDWSGAWDGIKQIVSGVIEAIKAEIALVGVVLKALFEAGWTVFFAAWSAAWDGIKSGVGDLGRDIWGGIKGGFDFLEGQLSTIISTITGWFGRLPGAIIDAIGDLGGKIWDHIKGGMSSLGGSITGALSHVPGASLVGLASGGFVGAGATVLVGEDGPELFTAPTDGVVLPASTTAALASGDFGGAGSFDAMIPGTRALSVTIVNPPQPLDEDRLVELMRRTEVLTAPVPG